MAKKEFLSRIKTSCVTLEYKFSEDYQRLLNKSFKGKHFENVMDLRLRMASSYDVCLPLGESYSSSHRRKTFPLSVSWLWKVVCKK